MEPLEDAIGEIERGEESVTDTEVRTKLDSIEASLREMLDVVRDEETAGEVTFADDAGAAPSDDNLRELEKNLLELAKKTENPEVRDHLETAKRRVSVYRTEAGKRAETDGQ